MHRTAVHRNGIGAAAELRDSAEITISANLFMIKLLFMNNPEAMLHLKNIYC
jgi:hypothetical protein